MDDFRFALGDLVRSRKIGAREAFTGEIVTRAFVPASQSFAAHTYYNVRAPDGSEWHRTDSELTAA